MSDEEIIDFSSKVNMCELCNYRIAVGRRTREIIRELGIKDIKKKVPVILYL